LLSDKNKTTTTVQTLTLHTWWRQRTTYPATGCSIYSSALPVLYGMQWTQTGN